MGDWRTHEPPHTPAHHSEPGDPILFEWIKHQVDAFVGLSSMSVAFLLGAAMLIIPIVILLAYMVCGRNRDRF